MAGNAPNKLRPEAKQVFLWSRLLTGSQVNNAMKKPYIRRAAQLELDHAAWKLALRHHLQEALAVMDALPLAEMDTEQLAAVQADFRAALVTLAATAEGLARVSYVGRIETPEPVAHEIEKKKKSPSSTQFERLHRERSEAPPGRLPRLLHGRVLLAARCP